MFKKVIILFLVIQTFQVIYSEDLKKVHYGISTGFYYTEKYFSKKDTNIESQVDSISLFLSNMKFGILISGEYFINKYFSLGLESGTLFNSYHLNVPVRSFSRLGLKSVNIKPIIGVTYIREVSYLGSGLRDVSTGLSLDFGARLEIFSVYFEVLQGKSLNRHFLDTTKISFGYSLFFSDMR